MSKEVSIVEFVCAQAYAMLEGYYDGAPDASYPWLGSILNDLRQAQTVKDVELIMDELMCFGEDQDWVRKAVKAWLYPLIHELGIL
jgi:hypothetical protein